MGRAQGSCPANPEEGVACPWAGAEERVLGPRVQAADSQVGVSHLYACTSARPPRNVTEMRRSQAHRGGDRTPGPRLSSARLGALLPLLLFGGSACGDGTEESRRAELELRYGPRGAVTEAVDDTSATGAAADASSPGTGAQTRVDSTAVDRPDEGPAAGVATPETSGAVERVPGDSAGPPEPRPAPAPPTDTTGGDPGSGPSRTEMQEVDVVALLAGAEEAYGALASLRASFLQVMEVPLLERTSSGTGVWYQKGRNRFKMDFLDPPDDEIVADGTYLWVYHPSQNPRQVIRSELAAGETDSGTADLLARILSEARTSYDAHYDGRDSVDEVSAHVVALTPLGRSPYRSVRIWIGPRDRLIRRFQIVERNESIRTVSLSDLEPNAALADSLFQFTVPPGADVFSG